MARHHRQKKVRTRLKVLGPRRIKGTDVVVPPWKDRSIPRLYGWSAAPEYVPPHEVYATQ